MKRGRLTLEEKAAIDDLALSLDNPTPGPIARKLDRHPATVKWYMLTHGLISQKPSRASRPYLSSTGRMIFPYSEEHDRRLLELRGQGMSCAATGRAISAEFGIERDAHSVHVRLMLLAAAPDGDDAAAA